MPRLDHVVVEVLALAAVFAVVLAGCDSDGEKAVAHVGNQTITKEHLERTVEHFADEAQREGKPFPEEGEPGFDAAEDRLIGLLVYRAELADQAESMGIDVGDEQVDRRLETGGEGEKEDEEGKEFARESVRAQLLYEAIYRKVTAGIAGDSPAQAAKRNAEAQRFIDEMKQRYAAKVRYEPGFEPGS
jgi:hypothetical protein